MPASTLITYDDLSEQIGKGVHIWNTHALKWALTNAAPNAATHTVLTDVTQIAATGGYTAGGYAVAGTTYTEAGGVATLNHTDLVITAAGGSVGPFQYAVLYNSSATSPLNALIGYLNYGSALTLADTETLTLDLGAATGVVQVTS